MLLDEDSAHKVLVVDDDVVVTSAVVLRNDACQQRNLLQKCTCLTLWLSSG